MPGKGDGEMSLRY